MKMNSLSSMRVPPGVAWVVLLLLILSVGCGNPIAEFNLNGVYLLKQEIAIDEQFQRKQLEDLYEIMTNLFGTPDEPHIPVGVDVDISSLLDAKKLEMAAGPVGSDASGRPHGLYRQHCAHCHGINGDGAGPTAAFLNPYPRDYRKGVFKFKSTPIGSKPTQHDLELILTNGIPDTSMPSFRLLPEDESASLIQYVKYLSIRGEVERALIAELADLDTGDLLSDPAYDSLVRDTVTSVTTSWLEAESQASEIPPRPSDWDWDESVEIGRELFFSERTKCSGCHGDLALGDGQTGDYDKWNEELINPQDKSPIPALVAESPLPPRKIRPRNLRLQAFRGGHRPIDIYRRVKNGIEGTPMPNAASDVSPDEIWHLVDYVRNLRFEALSRPFVLEPNYQRDRL